MGIPVLILGESGTGKSTSMRNFERDDIALVNVAAKPLPFRSKGFDTLMRFNRFEEVVSFIKKTKAKSIVIDDAQYVMSFQYMRRIKENGWDKFNEIQSDFFNLIDLVTQLPDDVIVYFLSHIETKDDGRQKIKTIGKMLDEKITIEGMFSIVLKTYVSDGNYYFLTQNSGMDTVKSPMGLFPSYAIDNDLKYVDEKIRNYYQIGDFISDEEAAEIDEEAAKTNIDKDEVEGRKRRSRRAAKEETEAPKAEELPRRKKREEPKAEEPMEGQQTLLEAETTQEPVETADPSSEGVPFDVNEQPAEEPRRRRRRA